MIGSQVSVNTTGNPAVIVVISTLGCLEVCDVKEVTGVRAAGTEFGVSGRCSK